MAHWKTRQAAAAAVLAVCCWAAAASAADDDGLRQKALALNTVTGADPISGQIQALVEEPAAAKKLLAVALKMTGETPQPFQLNATYILARTADLLRDLDAAQKFYRLHADQAVKLQSGEKTADAYRRLAGMLYLNRKYDECVKVCKEFLELPGDDTLRRMRPLLLERLIQATARTGKTDEATRMVENLVKLQPDNWLLLELKGWVQREAGQFEDAAKTYEDVLTRIKDDKGLEDKERDLYTGSVRYMLSGVYVDLKQIDKAAEHLKALLALEPNNPTYNNDLGYIWADHDLNLDESEKLIRKAIDEDRKQRKEAKVKPEDDKDQAAYLDSLGWVLYKQKKYKEAKQYLLEAVKDQEEGQHIEIYDHLGDAHLALGEKAEAVTAWKKGLGLAGPGKREQTRKATVEEKLKKHE